MVYEKSPEMKHLRVPTCPEEPELAASWAAGATGHGKNKRNGSNGIGCMYYRWRPGGQVGNPLNPLDISLTTFRVRELN